MSRNGSGTYNLPAGNPVVTATTITSTWANTTLSDIATALTGSLAADGQTPASGNLNMNTNQIKNVVDPTLAQDAATKAYVDAGSATYLLKASNLSDVANATTARGNLSAAKSGANSDITSIAGLTTPLTVAQGGIGAATLTANNVLLGNGTSSPQVVAPSTSGNVLTSNGTTWTSAAPTSAFTGARGQAFTANGTFTIPTGVTALKITVIGGGGGGGGVASGGGTAGGGGGGATAISYLTSLTVGNTLAVTIGGAGSAGNTSGSNGGTGGSSTVASGTQSITTITGGGGTGGGGVNQDAGGGGAGGTATNGTINCKGGAGTCGAVYDNGASITGSSGNGGNSTLGGGASGNSGSSAGNAGGVYGGGGSGARNNAAGGTGADGVVIFEW
jgi:hypothetical protein